MARAHSALSAPSSAPAALDVHTVRRQKLLGNLNAPTPKFLTSLLRDGIDADVRYLLERRLEGRGSLYSSLLREEFVSQVPAAKDDLEKVYKSIWDCIDFKSYQEFAEKAFGFAPGDNQVARAAIIGAIAIRKQNDLELVEQRERSKQLEKISRQPSLYLHVSVQHPIEFWKQHADEVLWLYQEALTLQPDIAPAYWRMGLLEFKRERYDKALEHFTHALSITSEYKLNPSQKRQAIAKKEVILDRKASEYYHHAAHADVDAPMSLRVGYYAFGQNNYNKTIQYLSRALAMGMSADSKFDSESLTKAYKMRAESYYRVGAYDKAIADYKVSQTTTISEYQALYRHAYQAAMSTRVPSIYFFQALMQTPDSEMFTGVVTSEEIDKDKLFAAINAVKDQKLKQNLLCQMLVKETFLGKLFYTPHGWFENNVWTPNVARGKLGDVVRALCQMIDAKEELDLNQETIKILVKDKMLPAASPELRKICQHVASRCKAKAESHEQRGEHNLALEAYSQAAQLDPSFAAFADDFQKKLVQHAPTSTAQTPSAPDMKYCVDPIKPFLLNLKEENLQMFFQLMLKPENFQKLSIQDVDKTQLLAALQVLDNKNLKQQVLRQALLPRTFFNNIFAENQAELVELFIAEVGFQAALNDEAIKLVFSNNDFQEKLAQRNAGLCQELQALLGVQVVVVRADLVPVVQQPASLTSSAVTYQAFGVSPAAVSHVDEAVDLQPGAAGLQPGAPEAFSEPEIRPDCDGAQPAAAARRVVNA